MVPEEAVLRVKAVISYTVLVPTEEYTETVNAMTSFMKQQPTINTLSVLRCSCL